MRKADRRARLKRADGRDEGVRPVSADVQAVLFDVDYTLIRPGAAFELDGYLDAGRRFGISLDPERWPRAQRAAWEEVERRRRENGHVHDMSLIPAVTGAVVATLAGEEGCRDAGEACAACAGYQAERWWDLANFTLYEDVRPCLERLREAGVRVGLISNTNRDLAAVAARFGIASLIDVMIASVDVGVMKPEPEIFLACLERLGSTPEAAAMVGDNQYDDIAGALAAGFKLAVLLDRRGRQRKLAERGEPVHAPAIETLDELPALLGL